MSQHYEWAVLNPDGGNESGIFTSGPFAPKAELAEGGQRHGKGTYDEFGDEETEITHRFPEGSYVARRVVSYGEWEPADDELYAPSREITTLYELDALPIGSVILIQHDYVLERLSDGWYRAAIVSSYGNGRKSWLPAKVLK